MRRSRNWYRNLRSFRLERKKRNTFEVFKIFENLPVEWNLPFELLPENSGFSVQMVSGPGNSLQSSVVRTCKSDEFCAALRADAKELLSSSLVTPLVCDEGPADWEVDAPLVEGPAEW